MDRKNEDRLSEEEELLKREWTLRESQHKADIQLKESGVPSAEADKIVEALERMKFFESEKEAYEMKLSGAKEEVIRETLPIIETKLTIDYADSGSDLGPLSHFIIDLDPDCAEAQVNIRYSLEGGKIDALFADIDAVFDLTKELDKKESEIDRLEHELIRNVVDIEDRVAYQNLLHRIVRSLCDISDKIENTGDRLAIVAIKKLI